MALVCATQPISRFRLPSGPGLRNDGGGYPGAEISPYYDPLVAKIIVKGHDRDDAVAKMRATLANTRVHGIETNLDYLRQILAEPRFAHAHLSTRFKLACASSSRRCWRGWHGQR